MSTQTVRVFNHAVLFLLFAITILAGSASAAVTFDSGLAVVYLAASADWDRFAAADRPVYGQMPDDTGVYLLIGADAAARARLADDDIAVQPITADLTGRDLYLAYVMPGQSEPRWADFGLLHRDQRQALLALLPGQPAALRLAGVKLIPIERTPQAWSAPAAVEPQAITPIPEIQQMINQVESTAVIAYDGDLSGVNPVQIGGQPYTIATRHTSSGQPIQQATAFVGEHLANLGLAVEYHVWNNSTNPNVIGEITGPANPEVIYLITAHLDDMPPGATAPGADDNASGSTAVLIAADIFSQYQWDCTIRFAFFTGEEQGLLGSRQYAIRSRNEGEDIRGVINMDMIGWNTPASSPDIDLHARSTVPGSLELAQLFADVIDAYEINLIPQVISSGSGASDHASFWNQQYPAILGIEDYYGGGDFNPYYHTTQDTLNQLDIDYFSEFVRAAIGTLAHASGCLVTGDRGTVQGHVNDTGGSPVAGARVALAPTGRPAFVTVTDQAGYYQLLLPPDTYTATVSANGYYPATVTGVEVITDVTTTQDFWLAKIWYEWFLPVVMRSD